LREAHLLKLFLLSIFASLAGTTAGLALVFLLSYAVYGERVDAADVFGFSTMMFAPALLMCGLLYTPGLLWLKRRRKNCAPARLFMLTPAFLLNVPAFAVLLAGLFAGNVFFGWSEVLSFAVAFIGAGLAFGRGFVRYCGGKAAGHLFNGTSK
jgi:hypothetical protein